MPYRWILVKFIYKKYFGIDLTNFLWCGNMDLPTEIHEVSVLQNHKWKGDIKWEQVG